MRLFVLSYLITIIITTASAVVVDDAAAATNDVDTAKQARSLRGDIRTDQSNNATNNDNNGNPNPGNGNGPPDKIIAIVTLKEESKTQGIANMCNQLSKANSGETKHTYDAVLGGCAIELPKPAMAGLKNNKHVEFVEEDQEAYTTDTAYSWGQDRIDQAGLPLNGVINRLPATNVRMYILDTGIHQNHNDFNGMIGPSGCHSDETDEGNALYDGNGHGTHVASTAVGVKYGVATCNTNENDCELCAVKVLTTSGSGSYAGVIKGINHVVSNCPSNKKCVANLSLGGGKSTSMNDAVKDAVEAGIVMAVAAGNKGGADDPDACNYSPASEPKAITVGSTDRYDKRSTFSSYGSCLDIYAPGSSIVAAKTGTTSSSSTKSGTSMASPHIAGLAAGILGGDDTLTPEGVRQKMLYGSVYLHGSVYLGNDPYGNNIRLATTVFTPSDYLLVMGRSNANTNQPRTKSADVVEQHEVRCCKDSETKPSGWANQNSQSVVCQNVWPASNIPSCEHSANFGQALSLCANMGGRLCTAEEIGADCTAGSGCSHDDDHVWSSTPPKYQLVMGRSNANTNQPRTKSADVAEQHEVRCCKDSETKPSGWANQNSQSVVCQNVWSASYIPSCEDSANFGQASSLCANMGGRLCTAEEIGADCTAGSGCSHDSDHVWSSTVADVTTSSPTTSPSEQPTSNPTQRPSTPPSKSPVTPVPSKSPTDLPTNHQTLTPSKGPTLSPITPVPSKSPSDLPSKNPTLTPSNSPTEKPTSDPSKSPSSPPTIRPTNHPTLTPSKGPTLSPITPVPSKSPSDSPSKNPTLTPSNSPTEKPTSDPSKSPSSPPTIQPTLVPSATPSKRPTLSPITSEPSKSPSDSPSKNPTLKPSNSPSMSPVTPAPSKSPTDSPTKNPTKMPSDPPTKGPTSQPTDTPTDSPTKKPTNEPTAGITYYTVCGNSEAAADGRCITGISATAAEETDVTALRGVRCCSDLRIDTGWKQHTNCANAYGVGTVWGESEIKANEAGPTENGVCHSDKTYAQAKQICANAGARLCTRYELENDCTRTTGCGFDFKLNWSSSSDMDLNAAYDDAYKAPRCNAVGLSCSSGGLLNGKASNVEPNPSNTIDGCADGTLGSYHGDESVDKITISSVNGGKLTAGRLANIETKVWAWSDGSKDFADFYHAADASASSITWTYLGSMSAGGSEERTLSRKNFQLSDNPIQAVRVRFRYNGSPAPCNNDSYDDADDLVFAVEVNQNILSQHTLSFAEADTNPEPTANNIATDCSILIEDRCNASPDECYWKNNNKGCLPLRKDPV